MLSAMPFCNALLNAFVGANIYPPVPPGHPPFQGDNKPPLKREVARSAGGILTHCQAESARNCVSHPFQCRGEHRSPGSTPLPCRASPLKRRRFVKASSLEEVARSAGEVIHQGANTIRPYRAVLYISLGVWKRETYYGGQIWASVPTEVSQNENHTKCAKSPSHRRGEHCSPGLTPLPCRASPL